MTLGELVRAVKAHAPFSAWPVPAEPGASTPVSGIAYDSRQAAHGSVFVALRGLHADGAAFARDAVGRVAIAVFGEGVKPPSVTIPWIPVSDARLALAALSNEFYGRPSERITLVGITGTNGKTTTSYLLASIF